MQIELAIDGEERIFVAPPVKARMLRNALVLKNTVDFNDIQTKELDQLVNFVCDAFGKQFSVDECYDGVDVGNFMPLILDVMSAASGSKSNSSSVEGIDEDKKK